jgi:type I restriction enzyme R subunit
VFSDLLKEAIAAAEAMFDHPGKQYTLFKDLEEQVAARRTPGVPDQFTDHPRAAAYYGALIDQLGDTQHPEGTMVQEAMHIETTVDDAVQAHSINPGSIEAEIRKALLPRYFKFFGGLDDANALINRIVTIVRAGANKS